MQCQRPIVRDQCKIVQYYCVFYLKPRSSQQILMVLLLAYNKKIKIHKFLSPELTKKFPNLEPIKVNKFE